MQAGVAAVQTSPLSGVQLQSALHIHTLELHTFICCAGYLSQTLRFCVDPPYCTCWSRVVQSCKLCHWSPTHPAVPPLLYFYLFLPTFLPSHARYHWRLSYMQHAVANLINASPPSPPGHLLLPLFPLPPIPSPSFNKPSATLLHATCH